VQALVAGGRLLPVLDGLDEMLPPNSRLVVRALNTALNPVVVTPRIGDYAELAAGDQGQLLFALHAVRPCGRVVRALFALSVNGGILWPPHGRA
jgi:hypothetical protein